MNKKCSGCHENLSITEFSYQNKEKGTRVSRCKKCQKESRKKYDEKRKELDKNHVYKYDDDEHPGQKKCFSKHNKYYNGCGKWKIFSKFVRQSKSSGRLSTFCKRCCKKVECLKKRKSKYNKITAQKRKANGKTKEYYINYRPTRNLNNKERRINDFDYRFKMNSRSRIYEVLTKQNLSFRGKNSLLQMDVPTYKEYLKYLGNITDENIIEDNYCEYWHIDHVIPCEFFKFESKDDPLIKMCFGWFNTRPIKKEDNLSKKDKIIVDEINDHLENLKSYIKNNDNSLMKYFKKYRDFIKREITN